MGSETDWTMPQFHIPCIKLQLQVASNWPVKTWLKNELLRLSDHSSNFQSPGSLTLDLYVTTGTIFLFKIGAVS